MNKAALVEKLSKDAGITKAQAETTIKSFAEAVAKTAKKNASLFLLASALSRWQSGRPEKERTPKLEKQLKSRPARPSSSLLAKI